MDGHSLKQVPSGQVFLCHSSADGDITSAVAAHLEANGLRCWVSSRNIPPGSEWAEAIYDAISQSRAVILLLTARSNESWQVRNELDIATNLRIPIIPVRLDGTEVGKGLRYFTGSHQWLDERASTREMTLSEILAAARSVIGDGVDRRSGRGHSGSRRLEKAWPFAALPAVAAGIAAVFLLSRHEATASTQSLLNLVAGGTDSWDYATDIQAAPDDGFFAAGTWDWGFWSEVWIARFDMDGDLVWSWSDSLAGECSPHILPVPGGGVVGAWGEYADFEHTGYSVRAARLDSLGATVWDARTRIDWPGAVQPVFGSMERAPDSTIFLAFTLRTRDESPCDAVHLVRLDPDGGAMAWDTIPGCVEACAYIPDDEGGAFNVYTDSITRAMGIEHFSSDGSLLNKIIVGERRISPGCAAITGEGDLVVCATSDPYGAGNGDLQVMEFKPDLSLLWQHSYGGDLWDSASRVLALPDGKILIAGATSSFGDGSSDGWILLTDRNGELVDQTVIDMGGHESLDGIAVRSDGSRIAAGTTTRFGEPDAWIIGLSEDGSYSQDVRLGIDVFDEGWQGGFVDQAEWLVGRCRNYSPSLFTDSLTGDVSIDLNCVPLISCKAYGLRSGLCLSADVLVDSASSTSGKNDVSIGLTDQDLSRFLSDPASARSASLTWTYTRGVSGQTRSVGAVCDLCGRSFATPAVPDSGWVRRGEDQQLMIEFCPETVRFWIGDSLFAEAPLPGCAADSVRIFLRGSSDSVPHRLDDVRLFLRRW